MKVDLLGVVPTMDYKDLLKPIQPCGGPNCSGTVQYVYGVRGKRDQLHNDT